MTDEMRSRVIGMILGSVSRGKMPKRDPIGFLYGHVAKEGEEIPTWASKHTINDEDYVGVVLPDIDTVWTDKEKYPYTYICFSKHDQKYYLYFSEKPAVYYSFAERDTGHTYTNTLLIIDGEVVVYTYTNINGSTYWDFTRSWTASSSSPSYFGYESVSVADYSYSVIWVANNVYDTSVNIIYSKLDPIPVYE